MTAAEIQSRFDKAPRGVGGWLLLLALSLACGAISIITELPGTAEFMGRLSRADITLQRFLAAEITQDIVVGVFLPLFLLALLLGKKRAFPKLYSYWAILNFLTGVVVLITGNVLFGPPGTRLFEGVTWPETLRIIVPVSLGQAYVLCSIRVVKTFVN